MASAAQLAPPGKTQNALKEILSKPFRPGQLFKDIAKAGITIQMDRDQLLALVTKYAKQVHAGQFAQNGFWTDHFTYYLDLIHNFVSIYPEEKASMLYDSKPIPFYLSPARVCNRTEKNMVAPAREG